MNVRKKRPDKEKARNLLSSAEREMVYTLTLNLSVESSNTILRNIYECFRMVGEALLVAEGFEPLDHVACIENLIKINLNCKSSLNLLESLRRLRHGINY